MCQEFYEICIILLYTSYKHYAEIWVESQFKEQFYELLRDCVSACEENVEIFAINSSSPNINVHSIKFRSCISRNVLPPQQGTTQGIVLKI